jgi:hypothetical protein
MVDHAPTSARVSMRIVPRTRPARRPRCIVSLVVIMGMPGLLPRAVAQSDSMGWRIEPPTTRIRPDSSRVRLALTATPPTTDELLAVHSNRIARALTSPESLLAFVTRPEPFYLERRAAAVQAKGLIPVSWAPRVWRLLADLQRFGQSWGMKPHPLYAMGREIETPDTATRIVLGTPWAPPRDPPDYPLTASERERAPWPWQAERAVFDLVEGVIPPPTAGREEAEAYLTAVLSMPCATDDDAELFGRAAFASSRHTTPTVMGALRNIAVSQRFTPANIQVAGSFADAARRWSDVRAWSIGAAGLLDILRQAPAQARAAGAYWIRSLREGPADTGGRQPLPAAVVIEASRRALDSAEGNPWTRLYVYAFSVVEALDERPFEVERNLDPASPRVSELLGAFARWYDAHRVELEVLARAQQPDLLAAERMMTTTKCRT